MQKTNFLFEVLIHDDASTDQTANIIRMCEKKYPELIKPIYQTENQYSRGGVGRFQYPRVKGKYIALCEGDDYWTDPCKIDKQIRFLEEHPDYIAVAHNCIVVDYDSSRKDEVYPQCTDTEYTFDHFARDIMPGQLTTVMLRNVYHDDRYDTSLLSKRIIPGDRLLYFWLLSNGKIHCIQEEMSAYRHVTNQGSSFSATAKYHFATYETLYSIFMEYARERNHKEALLCAERLYFRNLRVGSVFGQCSLKDSLRYFRKIRNKAKVLLLYIPTMLESRKQS
jgi:glycosyltransferase involved in cell wall biosynthesis